MFVKLLGCGYNEIQGYLCKFLMNDYGDCICVFVDVIRCCFFDLFEEELFWCLYFVMGSFVFLMVLS